MNSPTTLADATSQQQVVVFPPEPGIGVLAVPPPLPIGYKPQEDGALGININMVLGDRDGLLVYILAYQNMAVGDAIKVYIESNNAPVAQFAVTDAHFDSQGLAKNIPFYISATTMASRFSPLVNDNKKFWFDVQRVSGNAESSPPVPLFYKHPAPGEADTDGGLLFNQGLKLPVSSEGFIDQSVIDDGLYVTVLAYFNQSIGDVVVLAFGPLILEAEVTALGDVIFELTADLLATLAPTNNLMVRYEIFDRVENASGWSDALVLPFKPGVVLLSAPIFEQADPTDIIHYEALNSSPASILVTGKFAANDLIELTLQGNTRGGEAVSHTFREILLAADRTVDFAIDNEWVRNLIGGSLRATYTLTRAGKVQQSKPADVTVAGISQPLGLPAVEPLGDGKLPVDTAEATVRMATYWPLKRGAKAELRWQTIDQEGIGTLFIFQVIVTDPAQPVLFKVPAKYIAPYANKTLFVQNTITNPGEVEVTSQLLALMFGEAAKIELLEPFLVAPAVSPIDVLAYAKGVTVRVEYLGAQEGDRARLVEINAPAAEPQFPLVQFNNNQRTNTLLNQAFLAARQGNAIELRWNLNRGGAQAARSPTLKLTIQPIAPADPRLPAPQIKPGSELDITQLQASDRLTVAEWPGQVSGQRLWLRYEEVTNTSPANPYDDLAGAPHTQLPGLSRELPLNWLKALKNGSTLKISFWVNMAGAQEFTQAVLFPERTYLIRSLKLIAPQLLDLPGPNMDVDDIADSGVRIQVPVYTGMTAGQSVRVELAGTGGNYATGPLNVGAIQPLIFSIPRSVFVGNAGRAVSITYRVTHPGEQGEPPRSPPLQLNVLADTWRDSITDFNGNAGGWAFGPVSRRATIQGGYYENKSWDHAGNSGVVLSQTFQLKASRTYRFAYRIANISPQHDNVAPRISISTSSGLAISGVFVVPRTHTYYEQNTTFRVPASGAYTVYVMSHEDRGGGSGAQGGNEYRIDYIYLSRL